MRARLGALVGAVALGAGAVYLAWKAMRKAPEGPCGACDWEPAEEPGIEEAFRKLMEQPRERDGALAEDPADLGGDSGGH